MRKRPVSPACEYWERVCKERASVRSETSTHEVESTASMATNERSVSPSLGFAARGGYKKGSDLVKGLRDLADGVEARDEAGASAQQAGEGTSSSSGADSSVVPSHKPPANESQGCIYQLTFPNGKSYVGQTKSWKRRMRGHKCGSKRDDGHLIKRAIRKHGWANVQVNVLERVVVSKLNAAEVKWIARLGTLKPGGYNLTPGGDAQPMDNPTVAAWQKQRIGEAMRRPEVRATKRALWQDPKHREMMRVARGGDNGSSRVRRGFQRKRAIKVAAMSVKEGKQFMRSAKKNAVRNANARLRIASHSVRDLVAKTEAFWDQEIAGFEAGLWRTLASSMSASTSTTS